MVSPLFYLDNGVWRRSRYKKETDIAWANQSLFKLSVKPKYQAHSLLAIGSRSSTAVKKKVPRQASHSR